MIQIRPEQPQDHEAIYALTSAAFAPMAFSDGSEPDCLNQLRADGDLHLSLVALDDEQIVGHVAFSPATVQGPGQLAGWRALGPISVLPARQRQGIGAALISEGAARVQRMGAPGLVLIGNPDYYGQFGFVSPEGLTYRDVPGRVVQARVFDPQTPLPSGEVLFSPGLEV